MTPYQIALVQESFAAVAPDPEGAATLFYGKLFTADPSLRSLFRGDMKEQGRKLMGTIALVVAGLTRLDTIIAAVEQLGRRHADYGVRDAHYHVVGETLIDTLAEALGPRFTSEVREAWAAAYAVLATTMMAAAARRHCATATA
ncbi:MAG TPA: globin family protein [Bryobacteraceae bacterium]|nr:globin family protein [Bryobacteraceae bacterium]